MGMANPDLLATNFFYNTVGVLLGNGDGTFHAGMTYDPGGILPRSTAVADLNGDGKPDQAVADFCGSSPNCLPGKLGVLLNNSGPNGKMARAAVSGAITDTGSGVNLSSAAYSVTDEYGKVQPTGAITLGAGGNYSFTVSLQASRRGSDRDGRQYTITVRAKDKAGNPTSQASVVTVPHDQGK